MTAGMRTRTDAHGYHRVYLNDQLIGCVARVRVPSGPNRAGWRWVAMPNALSEPYPEQHHTRDEALEALRAARQTEMTENTGEVA